MKEADGELPLHEAGLFFTAQSNPAANPRPAEKGFLGSSRLQSVAA
jgi:hypothetical protein